MSNNPQGLPPQKGTYVLLMQLDQPTTQTIGRRGTFDLPTGWYTYVGSAFGSGGLRGRLKHHLTPAKKNPHWHIDYLRAAAPVQEIWYTTTVAIHEHTWATILQQMPRASVPVPRFGTSDCQCQTHLVYFPTQPNINTFAPSTDAAVQRWQTAD